MNMQELKAAATEADRMRVAMQAEQKILKESLQQKKDIINQLKQSIVDLRRETDKNGMGLNRQIQDYKGLSPS